MGSFVLFALNVCLIVGSVAASEVGEKSNRAIFFPSKVHSQPSDGTKPESVSLNEISGIDGIPVPDSIGNRNIINPPPRNPCKPCYRQDARKVCRKIIDCEE